MATTQSKATAKYRKKNGIINKSYTMPKALADEFKEACEKLGVPQGETIRGLMADFIKKTKDDTQCHN